MRSLPDADSKYDKEELERLNVESWMLAYLALNPGYVHWGPGEDYMSTKGQGWDASQELGPGWKSFGPWELDELNELVHFYFELERSSVNCDACGQTGYNPETKIIADTFYDHGDWGVDFSTMTMTGSIEKARRPGGATGRRWHDKITQDEVDALVAHNRLREFDKEKREWISVPRTAEEVNAANADGKNSLGHNLNHDGINRGILIETRAKRLGVYGNCPKCDGRSYVFTEPRGQLNVVLWMIHPRKGCSRGVRVKNLSQSDAAAAAVYIGQGATRNAQRFAKVTESIIAFDTLKGVENLKPAGES